MLDHMKFKHKTLIDYNLRVIIKLLKIIPHVR